MKRRVFNIISALLGSVFVTALFASTFTPAPAPAEALATKDMSSLTFDTALAPQYYGAGEYDGVLYLKFGPHGIVNGWYRPDDVGEPESVIGGLTGNKLWLDLGRPGLHDIQATFEGGIIRGGTYLGNQVYSFKATARKPL
jgi:hypothetical protein